MTKSKLLSLVAAAMLAVRFFVPDCSAQILDSNTAAGIPQSTSFTNAKVELFLGAVMQGSSTFNNSLEIRYNITPTIFGSAQIQNSPAGSVINAGSAYLGLRKAWDNTEVWLKLGGGRDWQISAWKGEAWAGIAYAPFHDSSQGFLNKVSTFIEQGIIISKNSKQASTSTIAGVTYHF